MFEKIRIIKCVEILHRYLRLLVISGNSWRQHFLRSWWAFSLNKWLNRLNSINRQKTRNSSWWCHVRLDVVRSWWN